MQTRRGLIIPFPLRDNFDCEFIVPRDLTLEEARRLGQFLELIGLPDKAATDERDVEAERSEP